MHNIIEGVGKATVMEYRISALALYMLKPDPIQVHKRLVGCEIHYKPQYGPLKRLVSKVMPRVCRRYCKSTQVPSRALISDADVNRSPFSDPDLEGHFKHLYAKLRPYDTLTRELDKLDLNTVSYIAGICRDMNGHESILKIEGDVFKQIEYISTHLVQDVAVVLDKAYLSNGLFELGGFSFAAFEPAQRFRLIKFAVDGKPRACVLGTDNRVLFWIEDIKLVYYLQMLGQLLRVNPKLRESFELCRSGKACALKLLFNRQVGIDYTSVRLPGIYRDVIERYKTESKVRDVITNVISNHQFAVMFNYMPLSEDSEGRVFSNLSLMHRLQALDAIREAVPQVYSEINNRAATNEVGKYYLLDCFRGYQE